MNKLLKIANGQVGDNIVLAVDFDNTLAMQEKDLIPRKLVPKAKETVNRLHDKGYVIIIWTCRAGEKLKQALDFLDENNVMYDYVNENIEGLDFETSDKIWCSYFIDDKNLGAKEPFDWTNVEAIIESKSKKAQRGMTWNTQRNWNGVDLTPKRYDQVELFTEGLDNSVIDHADDSEDIVDDAHNDLGIMEEYLKNRKRDNMQKYKSQDEKTFSQGWWSEKRMTKIIDKVLKEAKIK